MVLELIKFGGIKIFTLNLGDRLHSCTLRTGYPWLGMPNKAIETRAVDQGASTRPVSFPTVP